MYISSIAGVRVRRDDDELMTRLNECRGEIETSASRFIGVMNEEGAVYRMVVCSTGREETCVRSVLDALGFDPKAPEPADRGLLDVTYWKD